MFKSLCFALALVLPCAAPAAADDLAANAALKYWQAFATLPKTDEKTTPEWLSMPLDAKAKGRVADAGYSLEQMHYAAALPRCVWAVNMEEDGIGTRLPHCQAARTLAGLACLRARLRFAEGDKDGAVDDAADAITLGRHISTDGTIIAVLVGVAIDAQATDALAAHLPDLDKAALKKLAARLEALPPGGTMAEAMRSAELHGGLDWFVRQVKAAKDEAQLAQLLEGMSKTEGSPSPDDGRKMVEAWGGKEGILKYAEQARPLYEEAAAKMGLPPEEFDKAWGAKEKEMAAANPVFKLLFPAAGNVRRAEARYQARQALRKAALAILSDGPDAAKAQRDPFGDGPFEYEPFEGGFVLRSKLKAQDKPVSLTVGRRPEK